MQGACLQVGQADLAGASLPALAADATPTAGAVLPPQRLPVAAEGELAAAAAAPNGAALSLRVNGGVARPPAVRPVPGAAAALPPTALEGLSARLGMPSSSGGHSTENEMTATEEERARYQAGVERDLSFGSSGARRAQRLQGSLPHALLLISGLMHGCRPCLSTAGMLWPGHLDS
jgi:hypothetical protein